MQFKLFGRNLQISGDDWFVPGIIVLLFRLIWIPIVTMSIVQSQRSRIVIFLFVWTLVCTINEGAILCYSARGTIDNREARKPLFTIIPLEFLLRSVELFTLIPSVIESWSSDRLPEDHNHLLRIMSTGALVSVLLFFLGIGLVLLNSTPSVLSGEDAKNQAINRWENRIKSLLKLKSKLTNDQQVIVTEAAKMFHEKFPTKWAATDFSIAIWILSKEQLICRQIEELDRYPVASSFDHGLAFVHKLNMVDVSSKVALRMADYQKRRLARIQNASESSPLEFPRPCLTKPLYISKSSSFNSSLKISAFPEARLESDETMANSTNPTLQLFKKDIADILHFAKYSRLVNQKSSDTQGYELNRISILHVSHANSIFEIPFMICVDHEWKAVVISCRGTQSLDDILVDIKIAGSELDDTYKHRVRSGFLETAKNVYRMVLESGCLEAVFTDPDFADYRLVCTGHSLGAATSSLLAHLFRNNSTSTIQQYSTCICYAFACPAFTSLETSKIFEEHTVSIVCGHDIISRISYLTWYYFIQDIERILSTCSFPKHQILLSMVIAAFSRSSSPKTSKNIGQQSKSNLIKEEQVCLEKSIPMELEMETSCVPGKILYLEKLRDFQGRFNDSQRGDDLLDRFSISQYWKDVKKTLKKGLFKTLKNIAIGKLSVQKTKFYYTPRWACREEFHDLILSRSTFQDHSNLFDILQDYERLEDKYKTLRAVLVI